MLTLEYNEERGDWARIINASCSGLRVSAQFLIPGSGSRSISRGRVWRFDQSESHTEDI